MWVNDQLQDQQGFSTELFGQRARQFLGAHKHRPFFLTLSFNAVHNFTHQLPPDYLAAHGLNSTHDWDPAVEGYMDWYRKGRYPNNPQGRAYYLGQLEYLDREIGRVLDELSKLGLDRNTLIIFLGDNGGSTPIYANNGPLRGSKFTLYEGGIRVPMIIAQPGKTDSGRVVANVVSAMDILPTACRAAGVDAPARIDGIDLTPLLDGKDANLHHETLIWDIGHEYAVRDGQWKLHVAKDNKSATFEMVELEVGEFLRDLPADPGERANLADENPEVVRRLQRIYGEWRESLAR
jgi:arylsulfatase A-like enzyme